MMFEDVVICRSDLDLAELADAIVYYKNVEFYINHKIICDLIKNIGIENLIRFSETESVQLFYNNNIIAIASQHDLFFPNCLVNLHLSEDRQGNKIRNARDEIEMFINYEFGKGAITKRNIDRLINNIYYREQHKNNLIEGILNDIIDKEFLINVMKIKLRSLSPSYPGIDDIKADSKVERDRFFITSNIDFEIARDNSIYKELKDTKIITNELLIDPIIKMRTEMYYSGFRNCDIWTDDINSFALRERVNSYARRLDFGKKNINRFNEIKLPYRSFRDVINSKEKNIIEILDFTESAETKRFKAWLNSLPQSSDFLSEYEKESLRDYSFDEKIPHKIARYFFSSGIQMTLSYASSLFGIPPIAGDFIADAGTKKAGSIVSAKTIWKPNQWVSEHASKFLR